MLKVLIIRLFWRGVFPVVLFIGSVSTCAAEELYEVKSRFLTTKKEITVTLDACGGNFDWELAHFLVNYKIPVTIFVTKGFLHSNPKAIRFLKDNANLFNVQNHGSEHQVLAYRQGRVGGNPAVGTPGGLQGEVLGAQWAIEKNGLGQAQIFRGANAIYGDQALNDLIVQYKLIPMGYSLSADGGGSIRYGKIIQRMQVAKPGDVILGHINRPDLLLGRYIGYGLIALMNQGFEIVPLDVASRSMTQSLSLVKRY